MNKVIHIGGNKTASTTLQRHLFAKHPDIMYLGEDCHGYKDASALLNSLVSDDDSFFDLVETEKLFSSRLASMSDDQVFVFSNEDIMTSPAPSACARRLHQLLPDAQIVMVIRNQLTTWPSWYANHGAYLKNVPRRYWRKHVELDEWLEYCFAFPKQTPVEAMNYERFFNIFRGIFPESNIHVLLYEELLENPDKYYGKWAQVLGVSEAEVLTCLDKQVERGRNSARRVMFDRAMSKLSSIPYLKIMQEIFEELPFLTNWIDHGNPVKVELSLAWKERIAEYYRKGNLGLSEKIGVDLSSFGYPL